MLNQINKRKIPILMYHSIADNANAKFKQFTVAPQLFADQMAFLYQHKYTPITVTQLVNGWYQSGSLLPEQPVVLTFDDGFADFYTQAFPVLKRYNFTATLYVSTAFIGGTSRWLKLAGQTTYPMLTWEQLCEISMNRIECGAHSHSHPQLDTLAYTAAKDEIERSKKLLEDHLDREIESFAYPFGYQTADVRRLVRHAGYTSACAVKHAMSSKADDPLSLSRLMVRADSDIHTFAALLAGRSSSPVTAVYKLYAHARTPVWQLVRRCSASMVQHLHEGN
jgi:peptidoglycan/xylan/chitin deacetylase (PgdA/CDA1 family)